jgi:glycosyltransferase involved in cell wall biosynthesis
MVLTLHHSRGRARSSVELYEDVPDVAYVAVSRRQAALFAEVGLRRVIHNGLDPDHYAGGAGAGGYCAFVGRLAPENGPHLAIDAAQIAGMPIRLAGRPHSMDREFFELHVKKRLVTADPAVQWLGDVSHEPKVDLLRRARATLFPLDWEEPFGLAMIESMLVGTPVIAFERGSVAEIVEEDVTGYVVRSVEEMAVRIKSIDAFDRGRCRARALERWTSLRMAREYEDLYEELVREAQTQRGGVHQNQATRERQRMRMPIRFESVDDMDEPPERSTELFSPFWKTV